MCVFNIYQDYLYLYIQEINYMCSYVLLLAQAHITHLVWSDRLESGNERSFNIK